MILKTYLDIPKYIHLNIKKNLLTWNWYFISNKIKYC